MGDAQARPSAALDRGSAREPHGRSELPRAPLPPDGLRGSRRPPARARLRGDRRCRRLFRLSVLGLSRGRPDRKHPSRPLRLSALSLPHLFGCDQQAADPALPRRRPHRRLLRARGDARRAGARPRHRAGGAAHAQPGAAGADAVRQHRQAALRFRRLSRGPAAGGRRDRARVRCASGSSAASPTAGSSASVSPCIRSRPATERASMPGGAFRSCRATSNARRASPRTAGSSCGSARTATARGSRRRCRRSRTRSSACRTTASSWSTATPRTRPIRPAPGARAAPSCRAARWPPPASNWPMRVKRIGATLLQSRPEDVRLGDGMVVAAHGRISVAEIARTWYRRPQDLPADVDPGGLEVTRGLQGEARHRDVQLRRARHGRRRRPRDRRDRHSRLRGGRGRRRPAQSDDRRRPDRRRRRPGHRDRALRGDALQRQTGSRRTTTLADYLLPGSTEVPAVRIIHMETPSPYTRFGQKGLGEGGAIAPPAAITNAINDALKGLGAELLESPVTPDRIVAAIRAARDN